MGKGSEFTPLADYLRTCPQGEVKRNLEANLPCAHDSLPATVRTLGLLRVQTALSDLLGAESRLLLTKPARSGNEQAAD